MKELKDILNQMDAQPSADCWNKLSQRLDVAMPTQGHTANASQPGTSVAAKGISALSTSAKVVTAVLSTAAVAGIITIATLTHQSDKSDTVSPTTTKSVEQTNLTLEGSEDLSSTTVDTATPQTEKSSAPDLLINNDIEVIAYSNDILQVEAPASYTPASKSIDIKEATATTIAPKVTPTPAVSTTQQNATNTVALSTPTAKSTKSKNRRIIQEEDPVIQNMDQESIDWNEPVKLEIPNVFTPNGDGYNDYFVIKGIENCGKRQLIVRNRAGHIVYRNNNYENTWDGSDCPNGVYTYQFFYSSNGIDQVMSGSVTVLRK